LVGLFVLGTSDKIKQAAGRIVRSNWSVSTL